MTGVGVYEELGVKPFINAVAPHTRYGGSIMAEPVVQAMVEAARQSVNLYDLQRAAGEAIASLTHNEACYISCGAASGIQLAVAACITGTDEALALQLPRVRESTHVVMLRSHQGTEADTAIRNTGAAIRLVGDRSGATAQDIASAIDGDTVAVVMMDWPGVPGVEEVARAAHARGVPVIVDAADGVPPVANFWRYTRDQGADAVVISGGKGLRGPQNTGLVLGSRTIVEGCTFLGSPNDRFGRSMKVSKEAMAGVYAAVKHLVESEAELAEAASRRAETLVREVAALDGLSVQRSGDEVVIHLPQERLVHGDIHSRLMEGDQAIFAFCRGNTIRINAAMLHPGQEGTIAERLRVILG